MIINAYLRHASDFLHLHTGVETPAYYHTVLTGRFRKINMFTSIAMEKLMKGVYILIASLNEDVGLKIGALGVINFKKGFYAYTGSAMGGIEQRVGRHLRKDKKLHWHIDYLLGKAEIKKIFVKETNRKSGECGAAIRLEQSGGVPIDGFGSSDCKCKSHLFYFNAKSGIALNNKTGALRDFKQILPEEKRFLR